MAKGTKIEWADCTFNPWWGCERVSPACDFCYAEAFSKRVGLSLWGPRAPRRIASEKTWREPLSWAWEEREHKSRARVFCASMADVFEDRDDLKAPRRRLVELIRETAVSPESQDASGLVWMLLTKRPENAQRLLAEAGWKEEDFARAVWFGATVEGPDQLWRTKHLLEIPCAVRFVSCEPLLGPVSIPRGIQWVIAGGESGPHARPSDPAWFRALRDECATFGRAFFMKQWGEWVHELDAPTLETLDRASEKKLVGGKTLYRVGTKWSGALLEGIEHRSYPDEQPYLVPGICGRGTPLDKATRDADVPFCRACQDGVDPGDCEPVEHGQELGEAGA